MPRKMAGVLCVMIGVVLGVSCDPSAESAEAVERFKVPFSADEIEQVSIKEGHPGKTLTKVEEKHFGAVHRALDCHVLSAKRSSFPCEFTRSAVIRLKGGQEYELGYHAQCSSPEVAIRKLPRGRSKRLGSTSLKRMLMALEVTGLKLRFVRTIWKEPNVVASVTTTVEENVLASTSGGLSDRDGQYYKIRTKFTPEACFQISLVVTTYKMVDGLWDKASAHKEEMTLDLTPDKLDLDGSVHVIRSTAEELLVVVCEPTLAGGN
jgi:hypothetical protein